MRLLKMLPTAIVLVFVALVSFGATARAATAATGDDQSLLELLRPLYDAFAGGHYAYAAALLVIVLVALTKRYLADRLPWLHSDAGGTVLALLAAGAAAMSTGLAAPGAHVTLALLKSALLVGIGAAGGYAVIKNLIIEPLLKPLGARFPWLQPVLSLIMWIFNKPDAIKTAEKQGDAAVAANPPAGVDGAAGKPDEVK